MSVCWRDSANLLLIFIIVSSLAWTDDDSIVANIIMNLMLCVISLLLIVVAIVSEDYAVLQRAITLYNTAVLIIRIFAFALVGIILSYICTFLFHIEYKCPVCKLPKTCCLTI